MNLNKAFISFRIGTSIWIPEARPDYIWIDDNVRFGHMPIGMACFCDKCLAIYEGESGKRDTREDLKAAFNTGTMEEKLRNRKSWLEHNRNTMAPNFSAAGLRGLLTGFIGSSTSA